MGQTGQVSYILATHAKKVFCRCIILMEGNGSVCIREGGWGKIFCFAVVHTFQLMH